MPDIDLGNTPVGSPPTLAEQSQIRLAISAAPSTAAAADIARALVDADEIIVGNTKSALSRLKTYFGGLAHEAGIAFVATSTGNNATGVVGISAFPFSTVSAALAASPKICLLQDATWAGATLTQPLEIHLRNNCTLTVTGQVALAGHKFSILSNGNVYFNPATAIEIFPIYSSNAPIVINITGDISIGAALDILIGAFGGITAYINCRRVLVLRTAAVSNGLFICYNYTYPGIFFGSNIKFHSLGAALFSVGGPGSNPKIHFGANCLIWTDGVAPFGNAGSVGGIYATGLVFNTAAISVTTGVSVTGSATSGSWLRSQEFTAI